MSFSEIADDLSFLEDWESRISYVVDLGRKLDPLPEADRVDANKVKGCASQVWLVTRVEGTGADARLFFAADSDALMVKGLVALVVAIYSGQTARAIETIDAKALFRDIGLAEHLTAQRSNGVASMVERIRADARRLRAPIGQAPA